LKLSQKFSCEAHSVIRILGPPSAVQYEQHKQKEFSSEIDFWFCGCSLAAPRAFIVFGPERFRIDLIKRATRRL
jgi:hypothetical protein